MTASTHVQDLTSEIASEISCRQYYTSPFGDARKIRTYWKSRLEILWVARRQALPVLCLSVKRITLHQRWLVLHFDQFYFSFSSPNLVSAKHMPCKQCYFYPVILVCFHVSNITFFFAFMTMHIGASWCLYFRFGRCILHPNSPLWFLRIFLLFVSLSVYFSTPLLISAIFPSFKRFGEFLAFCQTTHFLHN